MARSILQEHVGRWPPVIARISPSADSFVAYKTNTHKWWKEKLPPSECWQFGEMVDSGSPRNHLWRFCWVMKVWKGRREVIPVNHWDGGQSHCHPPLCAGLSTPRDLSLDAVSFTWFIHKTTEGEAGEEIWSSVHYYPSFLVLWSTERTDKLGKALCVQKIGKVPEMSRAWGCLV